MNLGKCAGCNHSIELSIAEERKTGESLTDLNVVLSYQSPSTPLATVAVLLLSPRLSGLSPHAARVPQPSRHREGAQGLPCCAERKNEKVQLLEIIVKKKVKNKKQRHGNRAHMGGRSRGSETGLRLPHSAGSTRTCGCQSGPCTPDILGASYSTRLFLAGLHSLVVIVHDMSPLLLLRPGQISRFTQSSPVTSPNPHSLSDASYRLSKSSSAC